MSQEGLDKLREAATASPKSKKPTGPLFTFKFPKSVRQFAEDPESVTLTVLSIDDELHGNRLMGKDGNIYKKIALAVVKIDGRPVDWGTGEVDLRIEKCSPKVREQLNLAFVAIHRSDADEDKAFLASMTSEL